MKYILVLFYSRHGATSDLAMQIASGVDSVEGITAKIRTVPKVDVTTKEIQPSMPEDGVPYVTLDDLKNCSGIALGSPTRFGNMAAPMKYFWDGTADLWLQGALVDKPATVFSSSSSMHGGQETTLLTMMLPLLHHGAIIVGLPYTEPKLSTTQSGGTPYGVTHVAGSNNKTPLTEDEKVLAKSVGARLATIALNLSV